MYTVHKYVEVHQCRYNDISQYCTVTSIIPLSTIWPIYVCSVKCVHNQTPVVCVSYTVPIARCPMVGQHGQMQRNYALYVIVIQTNIKTNNILPIH